MEIMIGLWFGTFAGLALLAPEAFGRFADDFLRNVADGLAWLLLRY